MHKDVFEKICLGCKKGSTLKIQNDKLVCSGESDMTGCDTSFYYNNVKSPFSKDYESVVCIKCNEKDQSYNKTTKKCEKSPVDNCLAFEGSDCIFCADGYNIVENACYKIGFTTPIILIFSITAGIFAFIFLGSMIFFHYKEFQFRKVFKLAKLD